MELNADGTGSIQNSDNVITENPFQQIDFGEEYITDLNFDSGNLTLLTAVGTVPPIPRSGGGAISLPFLLFFLLLILNAQRLRAKENIA